MGIFQTPSQQHRLQPLHESGRLRDPAPRGRNRTAEAGQELQSSSQMPTTATRLKHKTWSNSIGARKQDPELGLS